PAARDLDQRDLPTVAGGGETLPVGTEGDRGCRMEHGETPQSRPRRANVPQLDRAVRPRDGEVASVRIERDLGDARAPGKRRLRTGSHVPDADDVDPGGGEQPAVGAEGNLDRRPAAPRKGPADGAAARDVPHDGAVPGRGCEELSV